MTDNTLDTVLGQAMVVEYAIPGVGAGLAALTSIVQALGAAIAPKPQDAEYSIAQAIADLGASIRTELAKRSLDDVMTRVDGWQRTAIQRAEDTDDFSATGDLASVEAIVDQFAGDQGYNDTLAAFGKTDPGSEARVHQLGDYFTARTTYHSLCQAMAGYLAKARGDDPDTGWLTVHSTVRSRLKDSLDDAITFAEPMVTALDDCYRNAVSRAETKAAGSAEGVARNTAFTTELRRQREAVHARFASRDQVDNYLELLGSYRRTRDSIAAAPTKGSTPGTAAQTPAAPPLPLGPPLGPRPAGVVRFLYETTSAGTWVGVLEDTVAQPAPATGRLVTQNAGSNLAHIYYQFGGGGLNKVFADRLDDAGQLTSANRSLLISYENLFGAGRYTYDAGAARTDRLTSLLVPVTPSVPPIGDTVLAVVYSVGPQVQDKGIEDEPGYRQIYADAFDAIAEWNTHQLRPKITCFRVTLLSTGIFAGASAGPVLDAQAARLLVDAAVAASGANPSLANLTVLVNSAGPEAHAFDTVARARGVVPSAQGFDLPLPQGGS